MLEAKIPARDPEDLNVNHILMCAAMIYHQTLRETYTHTNTHTHTHTQQHTHAEFVSSFTVGFLRTQMKTWTEANSQP